ncbi:MAG: MATE family efflux transporter, partial [Halothiobacillus sp.]
MSLRVAKNASWNIIGVSLPLLAGVLAVPLLLHGLGQAKLGVFSLALGIFGFAGVFDLGLGRALTQTIASEQGKGASLPAIAGLVRRGLAAVLALGTLWGIALFWGAAALTHDLFHLTGDLAEQTERGLGWLALALPLMLLSTSLTGVLEGLQHFRAVNLLRAPIGAATFLIPALVAQFTDNLDWVIASLALTRATAVLLWGGLVWRSFPLFAAVVEPKLSANAMWRFTGWLSVSNLVGPFMVHADRFYLANIFPPQLVALYTVPLDALVRATVLPSSAMNAAFPALAHWGAQSNPQAARSLMRGAGYLMLGLWFLPILLVGLILPKLLGLWLGAAFAAQALAITQWLMLGILINGFAHIPFALLQSAGRTDITAKIHLIELPLYAAALVLLTQQFGITGAAMAWFARVLFDTVLLYGIAIAQFPSIRATLRPLMGAALLALTILAA